MQVAHFMVKNILMALSLLMAKIPVVCVTVMEEMSPALSYLVMEIAATLTNQWGNAVENVNVCIVMLLSLPMFHSKLFPLVIDITKYTCFYLSGCLYNNVVLANGQSIPDPGNPCSECTCKVPRTATENVVVVFLFSLIFFFCFFVYLKSGSVRCMRKPCPVAPCPHPVTNPCGCPVCDGNQLIGNSELILCSAARWLMHHYVSVWRLSFPGCYICWWPDLPRGRTRMQGLYMLSEWENDISLTALKHSGLFLGCFLFVARWGSLHDPKLPFYTMCTPGSGWLRLWRVWWMQLRWTELLQWRAIPASWRPLSDLLLSGTVIHAYFQLYIHIGMD